MPIRNFCCKIHRHTQSHTYTIYIYIYIYTEREREGLPKMYTRFDLS